MSLLEITGLTHSFGENLLYKNAGFTLNKSASAQPGSACGENCNCLCRKRIGGIGGAYL